MGVLTKSRFCYGCVSKFGLTALTTHLLAQTAGEDEKSGGLFGSPDAQTLIAALKRRGLTARLRAGLMSRRQACSTGTLT